MPAHFIGALIACYVAAPAHLDAVRLAVEKLKSEGYDFEDLVDGKVHEIDLAHWDEHIASTWPEARNYFPPQVDMARFIQAGGVFFGPVCGYGKEG